MCLPEKGHPPRKPTKELSTKEFYSIMVEYIKDDIAVQVKQDGEILVDRKKNGKVRPWRRKKIGSLRLSDLYSRLGNKRKAQRLIGCAPVLVFEDGRLKHPCFCHVRLCPICAMRRSEKVFGQVSKIMNYMEDHEEYGKYKYIFLTLTIRNVRGDELQDALDKLSDGFKQLTGNKRCRPFEKMSKGWFRAEEITHNWDRNDYHPHVHLIIAVDGKYITEKENYIDHDKWMKMWRRAMRLAYDPWVHIRVVRPNYANKQKGTIKQANAVAEVSKYTVKDDDILRIWTMDGDRKKKYLKPKNEQEKERFADRMAEAVGVLDVALHNRRLVGFGGVFKTIHKQLKMDDPIDGDLTKTGDEEEREEVNNVVETYLWSMGFGNYVLQKKDE
jgi:plasmid rolling circle replication initiator protein Rep